MSVNSLDHRDGKFNAVTLRLAHLACLSPEEFEVSEGLPLTARHYPAHVELCSLGQVQSPLMLLSGWACGQRILGDGRRQIIRIILPGDAIGSIAHPSMPALTAAVALTPVWVADARSLLALPDEDGAPSIGFAQALAGMAHADEACMRDQIVRVGRQTAYERLVHLILELHARSRAVGLGDHNSFQLPLTQEQLGDVLGISVVHTNRTMQQIRKDKLLDVRSGRVLLHQLDEMRALSDWVDHTAALDGFQVDERNEANQGNVSLAARVLMRVDPEPVIREWSNPT